MIVLERIQRIGNYLSRQQHPHAHHTMKAFEFSASNMDFLGGICINVESVRQGHV